VLSSLRSQLDVGAEMLSGQLDIEPGAWEGGPGGG
jgi:hypothetical protein